MSDKLTLKDSLKQTMQTVKKYVDETIENTIENATDSIMFECDERFVDKEEFGEDLGIAFEDFRETLNTSSLNEIYTDVKEQDATYEGIDVFSIDRGTVQKPEGGNAAYYRVPAITITAKGTVIAFADVRYDTPNDNSGRISVFCRRSEDKGNTWGDPIEVCKFPTGSDGVTPYATNSRTMDSTVLASKSGKLFCLNGSWKKNANNWSTYRTMPDPDWTLKLSVSNDDGLTWRNYDISNNATKLSGVPSNLVAMLGGVGQGIQMYDGTLVFPVQMKLIIGGTKDTVAAGIIYSKDDGESWIMAPGKAPITGGESNVVEISPGELLMNARGANNRPTFITKDMGETWQTYYEMNGKIGNGAVGCQGSSTKITINGNEVFLHSSPINNAGNYTRDNITLYASYDWKGYEFVRTYYPQAGNASGAGYSCLATGKINGQLCLFALYERQGNIAFRNLGLDLKYIAQQAEDFFAVTNRRFEMNKDNIIGLLEKFSANEMVLFEVLDNFLNSVSKEEKDLLYSQKTRLAGLDKNGKVIDRANLPWNIHGDITASGNVYYYKSASTTDYMRTDRLVFGDDYTVDFDVCILGLNASVNNPIFEVNNGGADVIGLSVGASASNWEVVINNIKSTYADTQSFVGRWVHITFTVSKEHGIKIYHDKELLCEKDYTTGTGGTGTGTGSGVVEDTEVINYSIFTVGNNKGLTKMLNAKIANFKVYDRVITEKEIEFLYETRKKSEIFIYEEAKTTTPIPASLQGNVAVNISGIKTDEFGASSINDTGYRGQTWSTGGEVVYDIKQNVFEFNKKTANIVSTPNFLSTDFTIDFDVYINGAPGVTWTQVFCVGNSVVGTTPGFALAINGTNTWNPAIDGVGSSTYTDPSGESFIGRWIHLTASKSSTDGAKIYHDGQLVWHSQTHSTIMGTNSVSGYSTIAIGNNSNPIKQFDGKIANFRIYDKVLSATEITEIMNGSGYKYLRASYTPNEESWIDSTEIDWSKQELLASFNVDSCTDTAKQNVLSIGINIGTYYDTNLHFYYSKTDSQKLVVECVNGTSKTTITSDMNVTGTVDIKLNSEGLWIKGILYEVSNYPALASILALDAIQIGSAEGTARSTASDYTIKIKK